MPWRREWLPTPVFLPGKFHGLRSLEGYSPWGRKESDTTEQLRTAQAQAQHSGYGENWTISNKYILEVALQRLADALEAEAEEEVNIKNSI